jgi:hypothetical protein
MNPQFGQNFFYLLSNKLAPFAAIAKNNSEEWLLSEIENKFFFIENGLMSVAVDGTTVKRYVTVGNKKNFISATKSKIFKTFQFPSTIKKRLV